MLKYSFMLIAIGTILAGCVSAEVREVYGEGQISGEREIALVTPRSQAWVVEIERRLRDQGFQINRFPSVDRYYEIVSASEARSFNRASARAIVIIDGFAPNTSMTRCLGGGHSENCPPVSGTIFNDITDLVITVFE